MQMFRSKKPKTEYVTPGFYKDWSQANAEIESLGHRLDAVREIIKDLELQEKEGTWALNHWREVEAIVLRKWKHTVRLKETGLRQVGARREGPDISYDWWEKHDGIGGHVFPILGIFDNWINQGDLTASWAKAQEEKLQKARRGLA